MSREHIVYDDAGNIRRDSIHYDLASGSSFSVLYEYDYDKGIRQIGTTITYDGPEGTYVMPVNQLEYDDHDWLDNNNIGQLQTIEYGYTGPGWLNSINSIRGTLPRKRLKQPCDEIVPDFPSICGEYEDDVVWVEVDYTCEEMAGGMETNMQVTLSTPSGYIGVPSLTFNIFIPGVVSTIPAGARDHYVGRLNENDVYQDLKNTLENLFRSCSQGANFGYIFDGLIEIWAALYELKEEIKPFSKQSQSESLFGMTLNYEEGNPDLDAPARYNGDISWIEWSVAGESSIHAYGFQYDALNRLEQAINKSRKPDCEDYIDVPGQYDVKGITYDPRGNIKSLKRRGMYLNADDYLNEDIDDLTYTYTSGTNLLSTVTENLSTIWANEEGLKGTAGYQYDGTGRISGISYGNDDTKTFGPYTYMDLPLLISKGSNYVKNNYTAEGVKTVSKRNVYKSGNWTEEVTTYIGNIELKDGIFYALNHSEGRLMKDHNGEMHEEYFLKDHLGNIRVRFEDSNEDGEIQYEFPVDNEYEDSELIASYHYYSRRDFGDSIEASVARPNPAEQRDPFGMEWKGHFYYDDNKEVQRKRYNGKEFEEGVGLLDFGFRWYDPIIGRFNCVDPISEKFPHVSTYNYAENAPIINIDLWGLQKVNVNDIRNSKGQIQRREVNVSVNMKVINHSSKENYHFHNSLSRAAEAASRSFSTSFKSKVFDSASKSLTSKEIPISVNFSLSTKQVSSLNQVRDNDFVSFIVDELSGDGDHVGRGQFGNNISIVEADAMDGKSPEVLLHELGHNLGLEFEGGDPTHTSDGSGLMGSELNGQMGVSDNALKSLYQGLPVTSKSFEKKHSNTSERAQKYLEDNSNN